jgi:hypothetical protein
MPDGAVLALDVGDLLRLAGLDGKVLFLSTFRQFATDVFRAVVDPYDAGRARH